MVEETFSVLRPDIVVNLAAQAGVRYSIENPRVYIQSNIIGFFNILEACRHHPVEHLVYASSSSVYGSNEKVPATYASTELLEQAVGFRQETSIETGLQPKKKGIHHVSGTA